MQFFLYIFVKTAFGVWLTEFQGFELREVSRCTELIEDMIIPLLFRLKNK